MDGCGKFSGQQSWLAAFAARWQPPADCVRGRRGSVRSLYCISEGRGMPVKLGITADVASRWQALQASTWRPVLLCWSVRGFALHEAALKSILRPLRMHGEWFRDEYDHLKSALPEGADMPALEALINDLAVALDTPVVRPRAVRDPAMPLSKWVAA